MAPYPTSYEIEDIFQSRESLETIHKFDERLASNLQVKVMGHEHEHSGEHKGADSWKQDFRAKLLDMVDHENIVNLEVTAIGGGSTPWACVEQKTTGRAKSGKKWNSESVSIVRFNLEGKITSIRVYLDSSHLDDHAQAHKEHKKKIAEGTSTS